MRRHILEAAREAFAAEGYSGAATRRIALQAEAAETLIFRYFGTKAGLYRSAVLELSGRAVREFDWENGPPAMAGTHDLADGARAWTSHILTVVERHRTVLAGLLNHGLDIADEPELSLEIRHVRQGLFEVLDEGARVAAAVAEPGIDFSLAVRSVFATFVAVSAYSTLFEVPGGRAYVRDHRENLVRFGSVALLTARPG